MKRELEIKRLGTVGLKWLQHVPVIVLDVVPQRGILHKCFSAPRTEVGPLPRVLAEMHAQGLGQREPLAADVALERTLASVRAPVFAQTAERGVRAAAVGALMAQGRRIAAGVVALEV